MKIILTLVFGLLMSFPQDSTPNDITGNWEGNLVIPGGSLKIVFHISNKDEVLAATMDSPNQNAFGLKMDVVKFSKNELEMTMNQIGGTYKGTFKDGKFEGKWYQSGLSLDLNLTRIKKTGTS